jgi:hypothetical protein
VQAPAFEHHHLHSHSRSHVCSLFQVRIHSSYGCTIKIGYEEASVTGAGFFDGGVSISPEPDCGPGAHIDLIAEDWRLLSSGKKRLVFDHTCGIIPLCPGPNTPPPQLPAPAHPPPASPNPSPRPSPPPYATARISNPHTLRIHTLLHTLAESVLLLGVVGRFPPGTTGLPPGTPKIASPPSPLLPPGAIVPISATSIVFGLSGVLVLGMFGLVLYMACCLRRQVRLAVASAMGMPGRDAEKVDTAGSSVAMARINPDGKTSVVTGVRVGNMIVSGARARSGDERHRLLDGVSGF